MKTSTMLAGGVASIAVIWSAGWFMAKTLYVEPEADKVVEQLRAGDIFFSFSERTIGGFPFAYDVVYRDVKLSDGSLQWEWTAPTMDVGSGVADGGTLLLQPAENSKLSVEATALGGTTEDGPAVFNIASDALLVKLASDGDGFSVGVDADKIDVSQASVSALISDGKLRFDDLDVVVASAGDLATVTSDISVAEMELGYRLSVDGVSETYSSGITRDMRLTFEGAQMDVDGIAEFIASDGTAKITYEAASYEASGGSTGGPSQPPTSLDLKGGLTTAVAELSNGRAVYSADAADIDYRLSIEGMIDGQQIVSDDLKMNFEMPVKKASEPGSYAIGMTISKIQMDEQIWALVDPAKAIPRTDLNLSFDLGGKVRLLRDLGGETAGGQAVDVETLDIRDISLDGAGITATASGSLNVAGNASQPDGTVNVVASGVLALIDQMVEGGIIPPEAAGLYKVLIQNYTKPGEGPDELLADIAVQNGQVTVNGLPLQ